MNVRAIGDSTQSLYEAINARLVEYLRQHFRVTVERDQLTDIQSFLVTPSRAGRPRVLVLDAGVSPAETTYLLTHTAAHLLLGHADRPFATIVESKRSGLRARHTDASWHADQERQADSLTAALLTGSDRSTSELLSTTRPPREDDSQSTPIAAVARAISDTLIGRRHPLWQRAVVPALTRQLLLGTLRLLRSMYHRADGRRVLARGLLVNNLREAYCLAELMTICRPTAKLAAAAPPLGPVPADVRSWPELSELAEQPAPDPSRLN